MATKKVVRKAMKPVLGWAAVDKATGNLTVWGPSKSGVTLVGAEYYQRTITRAYTPKKGTKK